MPQPGWAITGDLDHKALHYRGRELVRLEYPDTAGDIPRRTLRFAGQDMVLHLATLSRIGL